jgi:putative ABC transport system permease protein
VGTLTLAGTLFISVVNVRASLMLELDRVMDSIFNFEVAVNYNGYYPANGAEKRAEAVPGVTEATSQSSISALRVKPDGTESSSFSIVGVRPESDFLKPIILSGRWLAPDDRRTMVISSGLAGDMPDVKAGDTIVLKIGDREQNWKVAGIMLMAFDKYGYASFDYVSSAAGASGMANSLYVRTERKDAASQELIGKAVEERLKDAGIGVSYTMTQETISSSNEGQFNFLVSFLLSMAAMVALIGGLGLAGMMGLSVMERTREIGVIRSIGASNGAVGGIVLTEGVFIGVLSWLLAIPLGAPFSYFFDVVLGNTFLDKPLVFVYTLSGPAIWLLIVSVISVIASLLPARRAVKMSIRETLAYE